MWYFYMYIIVWTVFVMPSADDRTSSKACKMLLNVVLCLSILLPLQPTVNSTRFASLDSKPAHTTSAQSSSTSGITATVRNDSVFSSGAPAAASPPVHHRRSGTQADVNSVSGF